MRPLLVLLLLSAFACGRPIVKPITGELVVTPQPLSFEPTFVGFPRELEVNIGNRSRISRTLTVVTTGAFTSATELIAAGGTETTLPVSFAPETAGDFTGTLTVSDEGETVVIDLSGTGLQPPVCASSTCETSTFDPELGRCVASMAADGTSCSNACLTSGTCANGRCVGTPVSCSDSNPCTLDACDPISGCLHPPTECAAPTNPCKAARCDSTLGCVESDVRDGTSCGASDCVTAQVCITGQCKSVAAPDGTTCAAATPCQGTGTCQQQACVQPPAGPLPELWSYDFPGEVASFQGVHDAAQNLYWLECADGGLGTLSCLNCVVCGATSYTADGGFRFRQAIANFESTAQLHHLLAGDKLVVANHKAIAGLSTANGTIVWSRNLNPNPPSVGDVADDVVVTSIAATETTVTSTLARTQAQLQRRSVVFQFDPATGTTLFEKFYDGSLSPVVVDELGTITFKVTPWYTPNPQTPPSFLVSLSPSGVERWRVLSPVSMPWQLASPVAVFQGELLLDDGEVRSMADGSLVAIAPMGALTSSSAFGPTNHPLMSPSGRLLLRMPQSGDVVNAISLRPGLEMPSWEVLVHELHGSNSISQTVATASGGFLVATGDSRHPTFVKSFASTGAERFSCGISWNAQGELPTTLLDGRWVGVENPFFGSPTLHVYDVGDEFPAQHGWTGARGSPSGANRPLP